MSKLPGRNESKRIGGPVIEKLWKPSLQFGGEGSIGKRKLAGHSGRSSNQDYWFRAEYFNIGKHVYDIHIILLFIFYPY